MKLTEVKSILSTLDDVRFQLQNGLCVPENFHITEVGLTTKNFIDCGGVVRDETFVCFQLWNVDGDDHRLKPQKMLNIIRLSEEKLGIGNHEVEVEFQAETIGRYGLEFKEGTFILVNKTTACLAEDACGIPEAKPKLQLKNLAATGSCQPGGGCC